MATQAHAKFFSQKNLLLSERKHQSFHFQFSLLKVNIKILEKHA